MFVKSVLSILGLLAFALRPATARVGAGRTLLALDANAICSNPEEFSQVLADTFVSGTALAASDAQVGGCEKLGGVMSCMEAKASLREHAIT